MASNSHCRVCWLRHDDFDCSRVVQSLLTVAVAQLGSLGDLSRMKCIDPQLGDLTFDSDIGWWEGRVLLPSGSSFVLYVHTPDHTDQSITDSARTAFEKMKSSELTARQFAARELLAVHNSEWSEGKTIGADEFIGRLVPAAIQVWPDGDAEMSFEDDDLFWGHEVGIRYRGGRFTEAVVQG